MAKWIRPLLTLEEDLALNSERYHCFNYIIWLDVAAHQAIKEEQFKKALIILSRKFENLRSIIKQRDGHYWFAEMDEETVELEMMKGKTMVEAKEEVKKHDFNLSKGPLWKATVLDYETSDNKYTIFLYLCHGMMDGTTCVKMQSTFLELLENILHGEPCDQTEMGKMIYGNEHVQFVKSKAKELLATPSVREESMTALEKITTHDALMEKLYKPSDGDYTVETMKDVLSEYDTKLLISKCKANGVTVNSALTAVVNFAYLSVFQKLGIIQDSYKITSSHWASFRRHLEHGKEALGCILGNYVHSEELSIDAMGSFWDYVKKLHADLHQNLIGDGIIRQEVLRDIAGIRMDVTAKETPFYAYHFSNYTNLEFAKERKIKILGLSRECGIGRSDLCLFFIFYTFRGELNCFADFIHSFVERDTVKALFSEILSILKEAI